MPAPKNDQNFVQAGSGGQGGWIGKLFGGIGDNYRARSMAQIQLDLHGERAKIDTEHIKERATHKSVTDAAAKDYLGESSFKREKRRAGFYKKQGVNLADTVSSSGTSITFQAKGLQGRNKNDQQGVETPSTGTPETSKPKGTKSKSGRSSGTEAAPKPAAPKKVPPRARPSKGGGTY
jgi:hypothetical protein